MSWTKGALLDAAFSELSMATSVFDITPEEQQLALARLDAMLGVWESKGIKVGYAFGAALGADSGLPDAAIEPVFLNLARRLGPVFGKTLNAETLKNAREGFDALLWNSAHPIEQQLDNTVPRGAGNKPWRRTDRPFMPTPDTSPLANADSGDLEIQE